MDADMRGIEANAEYMIAAYVVTALIVSGYAIALWRKAQKTRSK